MNAGGISVPIFTTYAANDYAYIIKDCNLEYQILQNPSWLQKIRKFYSK